SDDVNLGSLIGVNARVRISQRKFENFIAESQRRPQNNAAKISVRGIVESVESRNIYSELPNRIVSVNVVEGDRVEQGQVLAALNSEDLNIQRASAAAALRMAEIDSARAQHNHDNTRALYGRGIARDELRQAEFTLQSKTAAKNLAQTQLDAINATLRRTSIRSPMDGTITSVIAKVGEIAVSRLFTVENTENLRIIARFREQDLPKISVGTTVSITTDANPDKVYSGKITRINPAATAQSPVPEFETEIQVVSENSDLRIGMNVRVVVDL
ncbi:MAG: efflux RND transporter periplasmic adaptor subunit, partial [Chitinivibrionia bacterium]|nr:efflux RND transporter periplasmic adaptor subunit [Chitinivibrionia bacterium]